MKNSKLITLLKTFSIVEFKEFEKFVGSSYFGRGRDLLPLFKAIKLYYPEFSDKNLTDEKIYKKIYPGQKFGDAKSDSLMKTLASELYKMCLEFLVQLEFKRDENRKSFYLLDQLRKRKHYTEFEKVYENASKQKDNSDRGGITDFIEKYFLNAVFRDYSLDRDDFTNSFEFTLATDENIVSAALMSCFMIEDMKNISAAYNLPLRYTLMNNVIESLNCEKLLSEMKKNNDRFYPYILIFFMIYKMNKHKDKREFFHELKKLLIEHKNLFGQSENYVFWNILLTYCNLNSLGRDQLLSIYDHILKNNVYKKSGEDFHIILFRNIVIDLAVAGEFEWLENFILKYSGELHIDHRTNMYNFSYAYFNFAKGNFETSLDFLGKFSYDLFIYKIDVRILLLKIYYELSYIEQAHSLIDSTLHFLKNTSEFSEEQKHSYRVFIQDFKVLLKLKSSQKIDPYSITILKKKDDGEFTKNDWLLMKIAELKVSGRLRNF